MVFAFLQHIICWYKSSVNRLDEAKQWSSEMKQIWNKMQWKQQRNKVKNIIQKVIDCLGRLSSVCVTCVRKNERKIKWRRHIESSIDSTINDRCILFLICFLKSNWCMQICDENEINNLNDRTLCNEHNVCLNYQWHTVQFVIIDWMEWATHNSDKARR